MRGSLQCSMLLHRFELPCSNESPEAVRTARLLRPSGTVRSRLRAVKRSARLARRSWKVAARDPLKAAVLVFTKLA